MLELPCIVQILMIFAIKSYIYMFIYFYLSISCLSRFIKEHAKCDVIFPAPITVRALEIAHKFLFDSLFTY